MKIRILSVGTKMPDWVQQGFADYHRRLNSIQTVELVELPLAKRSKNSDVARAMADEAEAIQKHLKPGGGSPERIIVLDVLGKQVSTQNLADKLSAWQMEAIDIALIIGGPDGLDARMKQLADESWSISKMTLPHPLVRLVLIEQLYRGLMINNNHPYHRE